ncbi:MAG: hypothetical protein ACOC3V_03730 [bacterium]
MSMTKNKPLSNFQESTIEEIQRLLGTITDSKSWKNIIHEINKLTSKNNLDI